MTKPVRIQRSRKAGYNMQAHSRSINGLDCVYVGRPSKWGNPFVVGDASPQNHSVIMDAEHCTEMHKLIVEGWKEFGLLERKIKPLKGKNLSCWCPLDKPCHSDVLLELANKIGD